MSSFLNALQGKNLEKPPIWLMRQAGRYLPEYRALRERYSISTLFHTPQLAAKVSLFPIERFAFDAAIVFSDILVAVEALGFKVQFPDGKGPYITPSISPHEVEKLVLKEKEVFSYVKETVALIRASYAAPLIGFCGAPFTIATYLLDRSHRGDLKKTREWMEKYPKEFHLLLSLLTEAASLHLEAQIDAGANVVQIFDSWAGLLEEPLLTPFALQYDQELIRRVKERGIPLIFFCRGSSRFPEKLVSLAPNAISVDHERALASVREKIPKEIAIQGNIPPEVLASSKEGVKEYTLSLLDSMGEDPRWIVNLGHGILPNTPIENVELLISLVRGSLPRG